MTSPNKQTCPVLANHRILIVEDQLEFANAIGMVLSGLGATVAIAHDADGALCEIERGEPNVIVADIGLPGRDGIWLSRRVHKAYPDIKLIAVTGFRDPVVRRAALKASFATVITKPIDVARLVRAIVNGRRVDEPEPVSARG